MRPQYFRKKPTIAEGMLYIYPASNELVAWLGDSYSYETEKGIELTSRQLMVPGHYILKTEVGFFYCLHHDDLVKQWELS